MALYEITRRRLSNKTKEYDSLWTIRAVFQTEFGIYAPRVGPWPLWKTYILSLLCSWVGILVRVATWGDTYSYVLSNVNLNAPFQVNLASPVLQLGRTILFTARINVRFIALPPCTPSIHDRWCTLGLSPRRQKLIVSLCTHSRTPPRRDLSAWRCSVMRYAWSLVRLCVNAWLGSFNF